MFWKEWNLRDVRRFLHGYDRIPMGIRENLERILQIPHNRIINPPYLDRIISKYGGKILLSELEEKLREEKEVGKSRPKETEKVSEATTQTSQVTHGGDGNSGEVDAEAETFSETPEKQDVSQGGNGSSDEESEDDLQSNQDGNSEGEKGKDGQKMSFGPVFHYGGSYTNLATTTIVEKNKEVKDVLRSLKKVFQTMEMGTFGDPSPRLDNYRFVREIVSKRYNQSRCHREEMEQKMILLLADVSGSCSASAKGTLQACKIIRSQMQESIGIIVHSNGFIQEWELPEWSTKKLSEMTVRKGDALITITDVVQSIGQKAIGGIVAFGDDDAVGHYADLTNNIRVVWLDSYCARDGIKIRKGQFQNKFPKMGLGNLTYITGINDTRTAAIALRLAAKQSS